MNRDTLADAIQSVLDQSMANWKLVIVGDGVYPEVNLQTSLDDRITLFEGEYNGSIGLTRNQGVMQVQTEWVGFLDDDDILEPDYVLHWATRNPMTDVLVYKMNTNGHIVPERNILRYGNIGMNFATKYELARNYLFRDERTGGNEDWDFIERVLKGDFWQFEFVDYVGYYVRPRENKPGFHEA